jgi:hypothetical protein
MASSEKWIQGAVPESHEGLFTRKAHAAGKSVAEYAQEKKHAGGKLGHEALFAANMRKLAAKRKGQQSAASKV